MLISLTFLLILHALPIPRKLFFEKSKIETTHATRSSAIKAGACRPSQVVYYSTIAALFAEISIPIQFLYLIVFAALPNVYLRVHILLLLRYTFCTEMAPKQLKLRKNRSGVDFAPVTRATRGVDARVRRHTTKIRNPQLTNQLVLDTRVQTRKRFTGRRNAS